MQPTIKRIPNEHGGGMTIIYDDGMKPEPTADEYAERQRADRTTADEICDTANLTPDELTEAIGSFGFPRSTGMTQTGFLRKRNTYVYSRSAIREWQARFAPLAQKLIAAKF